MAELASAIVGLSLVWKGILDFAKVINRLTDDDERERKVLRLGLRCCQIRLEEWGKHWGVSRDDGRFHQLEKERKNIVIDIIFQLHDSRVLAIKRLRKGYGMFSEGNEAESVVRGNRLSRLVDAFVAKAEATKKRIRWISGDDKLVSTLVDETMKLHGWLDWLTSMPIGFLTAHLKSSIDTQSLEARLERVEIIVQENVSNRTTASHRPYAASIPPSDDAIDDKTLAGYATNSIMSSKQREDILELIERSREYYGDSRVTEKVTLWWIDARSSVLLLELPDEPHSEAATAICVLLYYVVSCPKLIFIFDVGSRESLTYQFVSMIRMFIQTLVSLREISSLSELSLPIDMADIDHQNVDASTMEHLIRSFHILLRNVVEKAEDRFLIVVGGLDVNTLDNGDLLHLVQMLISGVQEMCLSRVNDHDAILQALFTHGGYANNLYESVEVTSMEDLTDYAPHESSWIEDLASIPDS